MSAPDVSVVMPVHDGATLVGDAVASVQRQEDVAFELLVHDDGSTDETPGVLAALARADPRIRVSRADRAGPAAARNAALGRARGRYVAFLDHDDLWPEGRLARQVARLEREPAPPAILGETFVFDTLDAAGRPAESPRSRRLLTGLLQAGLFRRAAVESAGGFDPELAAADDFDLLLRVAEAGPAFTVERELAAYYRLRPGQWTADLETTGEQTARALARSLARRRRAGTPGPLRWAPRP